MMHYVKILIIWKLGINVSIMSNKMYFVQHELESPTHQYFVLRKLQLLHGHHVFPIHSCL